MNTQALKLEIIEFIRNTNDIEVLHRLKELLEQEHIVNESEITYHKENMKTLKSLTLKELNQRLDASERDYKEGKFKSVDKIISKYS